MRLFANDIDITDDIEVTECVHDMFATGRSDSVRVDLSGHSWDFKLPDFIRVIEGVADSGKMNLISIYPDVDMVTFKAQSVPASCFMPRSRSWEAVTLHQIITDIARENELGLNIVDIENQLYPYVVQDNEGDLLFLARILMLESAALIVYDDTLVAYSEVAAEAQNPIDTITVDADASIDLKIRAGYGSAEVSSGEYRGSYKVAEGTHFTLVSPVPASSNVDCQRWARGVLRAQNKRNFSLILPSDLATGLFAANTLTLDWPGAPASYGKMIVDHIRHDYVAGTSKLFLRACLEGY